MIQTQVVPINFGGGLDGKTDQKMTLPGTLTVLENGVFTKGRRISKRNGYDKLGEAIIDGAASIGASNALGVFKPSPGIEELLQFGNGNAYSYSSDQSKWANKAVCESVILKYRKIYNDYNDVLNGDVAINGNFECYVWRDATNGYAGGSVIDSTTGVQLQVGTFNTSIGRTRVVSIGTKFFVFYVRPTSGNLVFRTISTSSPQSYSAETVIGTVSTAMIGMDAVSDGTNIWVCYYDGTNIVTKKLDSDGTVLSTASFAKTIDTSGLTLCVNTNVFVYWFNATNGLEYRVYDSSLASVLSPTVIDPTVATYTYKITAVAVSATQQKVFFTNGAGAISSIILSNHVTYSAEVSTAGVVTPSASLVRSVTLASKAFSNNGIYYFFASHLSDLQSTLFLFRSDGVAVGRAFTGKTRGTSYSMPSVALKSANKYVLAQAVITKYEGNLSFDVKSGISALTIDFNNVNAFQNGMLGKNLHIVGGFLSIYDGKSVVESGFHLYPEYVTGSSVASGGSIADGTYQYAVVYEWVDNMGQVHKSASSVPITKTVSGGGGNGRVDLTIPTLRITEKKGMAGEVAIQIYRTKASGTVFYNVKAPTAAILYNSTTSDAVSYTDTASDSSIADNEILYTTGDVLDNDPAPSCSMLDVYQSRMVLAGLEDPLEFQYSKTNVKGEGVAFSDLFVSRIDPFGGDITAVKLMDDKIILFKENAIFFVSGEGPADTGAQNNYTIPQLITADCGCPYQSSVVLMPLGIMFKSNKGIYILTRSLQVEYIGAPVEDYNSQDITSAELINDKNQIRFLTSSGNSLVYDYFFKQWSTFTNHTGKDAVIWGSVYTYLRNNGQVYKESISFLDDTAGIILKAATAWIKLAGIQGFQRVRRIGFLGEYKSTHQLQVRVGYDYNSNYNDTYTFDAASVIASVSVPYQFRQHLRVQKCEALRFEFSDVLPISPGESYNMSDLSLEVGIKSGINRLKSAQSI